MHVACVADVADVAAIPRCPFVRASSGEFRLAVLGYAWATAISFQQVL